MSLDIRLDYRSLELQAPGFSRGVTDKANRHHDTHEYICDKCGYRSNDDRIGAMNIQFLGTLWVSGDEHPRFGIRKEITSAE